MLKFIKDKPIPFRVIAVKNLYKSPLYYVDNNSYYYLTTQYITEHKHYNIHTILNSTITSTIINN